MMAYSMYLRRHAACAARAAVPPLARLLVYLVGSLVVHGPALVYLGFRVMPWVLALYDLDGVGFVIFRYFE